MFDSYLKNIPEEQRAKFLADNHRELAKRYLNLIVKGLKIYPNIVACTTVHTLHSSNHAEESKYIKIYNEIIKMATMELEIFCLDLGQTGIYPVQDKGQSFFITSVHRRFFPLVNKEEDLTYPGSDEWNKCIATFQWQISSLRKQCQEKDPMAAATVLHI